MRLLSSSLMALGFLAALAACDSAPNEGQTSSLAAQSCGSFAPGLVQYEVYKDDDTLLQGFAAVTQDHLCRPRYVQIDDCGNAKEAMQFGGYFQSKPRLINANSPDYEAFIQQVEGDGQSGDFHRLPHLSCGSGAKFPLEPIREGTFVVGDSSDLGRTSFVAKTEAAGQIVYSFPSTCLRMRSFFDLDRLFLDDRVKVLDELPRLGEADSEITFGCGYERPTPVEKDVWRIYRIKATGSVFYLLRYAAGQADEAVELLIRRVDGQVMKTEHAALEADLQKIFQRPIETADFSLDFENGDRPLLDICMNKCGRFVPLHELRKDNKLVPWQPHPPQAGNPPTLETFRQDASVLPDGRALDTLRLPSGKTLHFALCGANQSSLLALRFGFSPSGKAPTSFEAWQEQIKASITQRTPTPLVIPCPAPQADVCRVSIAANTDLSSTMSQQWDGISQLIGESRQKAECRNATTLRLELQGEALITGTAWTIGNPSQITPYRTIQIIGRSPNAALVQQLKCKNTCGKNEAPVLRIVGDATVGLQGFNIRTNSLATSVRTLALLREGDPSSLAKLHLRKVGIGEKERPFHTGVRLRGGMHFFHDLEVQAYFKGIRADSSRFTLTGSRGTGPLLPTGTAQITVLDIDGKDALPDLGENFYRDSDGVALQTVNTQGLVYLSNTRAPRGWSLGVGTRITADKVDLANSKNRLQDVSQAFLLADSTSLDIGSLKVQDYATLLYFTGVSVAQASVRTANFIAGSYTTSPANFILNRERGLINFEAETGTEKGLSCIEDPELPGRCTF